MENQPIVGRVQTHPVVPGLYLIPQPHISDHNDPRECARCGRRIGYAQTALRCGPELEVIHLAWNFDCKDDRNW